MIKGVFGKLLLMNLLVIAVTLLVVAFLQSQLLTAYIFDSKEKELQSKGREMSRLVIDFYEQRIDEDTTLYLFEALDGFLDARIWMIDREGMVVMASYGSRRFRRGPGFRTADPESVAKMMECEMVTTRRYVEHFDEVMLTVGVPITREEGGFVEGALLLHAPVRELDATVSRMRRITAVAGLVALFFALLIGFFYSRRLSVPLRSMSENAMRMAGGDFSQPVEITTDDEVGRLGQSLNYLSRRLDKSISELKQEKNKFASMVTGMQEGVMSVSRDGNIVFLNDAASQLLSLDADETVNRLLEDVFPDTNSELPAAFSTVFQSGEAGELVIKKGESVLSLHISPVSPEKEEEGGDAVALIRDISESEKLETMRKDFIANVSHELRTPITTISGFTGSLLDETVTEEKDKKRFLKIIGEEAMRMNRLISNLLDLSRLESGNMKIEKEPFSLKELVEDVTARLRPLAEEKNIGIITRFNEPYPVNADSQRIEQVLYNLLENAIRYIPENAEIEVGASRKDPDGKVEVYVKDSGPGIPENELPYIWDRFHRVEKSRSRREGGTGLGLAIVKQIIEAHGSWIEAENISEGGLIFRFQLTGEE